MDINDGKLPGKLGIDAVRKTASRPPHKTASSYPVATRPRTSSPIISTVTVRTPPRGSDRVKMALVSVFYKNTRRVLSYDVLRQQKTGVMTKGFVYGGGGVDLLSGILRRARHKHFVVVLCKRWTPQCARRSPPFVAALFFTLRDSYG